MENTIRQGFELVETSEWIFSLDLNYAKFEWGSFKQNKTNIFNWVKMLELSWANQQKKYDFIQAAFAFMIPSFDEFNNYKNKEDEASVIFEKYIVQEINSTEKIRKFNQLVSFHFKNFYSFTFWKLVEDEEWNLIDLEEVDVLEIKQSNLDKVKKFLNDYPDEFVKKSTFPSFVENWDLNDFNSFAIGLINLKDQFSDFIYRTNNSKEKIFKTLPNLSLENLIDEERLKKVVKDKIANDEEIQKICEELTKFAVRPYDRNNDSNFGIIGIEVLKNCIIKVRLATNDLEHHIRAIAVQWKVFKKVGEKIYQENYQFEWDWLKEVNDLKDPTFDEWEANLKKNIFNLRLKITKLFTFISLKDLFENEEWIEKAVISLFENNGFDYEGRTTEEDFELSKQLDVIHRLDILNRWEVAKRWNEIFWKSSHKAYDGTSEWEELWKYLELEFGKFFSWKGKIKEFYDENRLLMPEKIRYFLEKKFIEVRSYWLASHLHPRFGIIVNTNLYKISCHFQVDKTVKEIFEKLVKISQTSLGKENNKIIKQEIDEISNLFEDFVEYSSSSRYWNDVEKKILSFIVAIDDFLFELKEYFFKDWVFSPFENWIPFFKNNRIKEKEMLLINFIYKEIPNDEFQRMKMFGKISPRAFDVYPEVLRSWYLYSL